MSLVLNVEILGEFKKLTAATQGANKQLKGMGDRSRKISKGINRAFGAIGVGLSFGAIVKGFQDTTKAAQGDIRSRDLLTLAIKNNSDATEEQIAQVHAYTDAAELSAAVNEEELRPAFANLVRATKDVTQAQELMEIALDVSAGTGKSLDAVTQAMGRALNGNTTALNRLVPALKDSKNPMEDLGKAFKGANEEAAKQKTWERLKLVFDRISDEIGHMLLPILEDFADWFIETWPKIEDFFKKLKKTFDDPAVKESFSELGDAIGRLGKTLRNLFGLTDSKEADDFVAFFTTVADVLTIITEAINVFAKALKTAFPGFKLADIFGQVPEWLLEFVPRPSTGDVVTPGSQLPNSSARSGGSKTYNINIGGSNVSAQEIVNKIAQLERSQGRQYLYA
jgi:hypothetical protein